jgi:hypothetical protein
MRKARPPVLLSSRSPLWGVLVAAGLLGCPKRVDFGPRGEIRDAAEVLRLLAEAEARVTSIDAEGRLSFEAKEGKASLGAFLVAVEPGRLQLQAMDFFGRPQSQLVSDGQRFGLYLAAEGLYFLGPASPANLARFVRVPLSPEELVSLLLGRAPRLAAEWRLEVDREAGAYRLSGSAGPRSQTVWVDPVTFRALRTEVAGDTPYRARFEDLKVAGPVAFPRTIVLESPQQEGVRIDLQYQQLTVNGQPDPSLFAPEPPEGVRIIELDERGDALSPTPD